MMWSLLSLIFCLCFLDNHASLHSMDSDHHSKLHEDNHHLRHELNNYKDDWYKIRIHHRKEWYFPGKSLVRIRPDTRSRHNCWGPAKGNVIEFHGYQNLSIYGTVSDRDDTLTVDFLEKDRTGFSVFTNLKSEKLYMEALMFTANNTKSRYIEKLGSPQPPNPFGVGKKFLFEIKLTIHRYEMYINGQRIMGYQRGNNLWDVHSFKICNGRTPEYGFIDIEKVILS